MEQRAVEGRCAGGGAVSLQVAEDTLGMWSQMPWQVREAVPPPPVPCWVTSSLCWSQPGVPGTVACGLSSSPPPACSPGAQGLPGDFLKFPPRVLQPSWWGAFMGHLSGGWDRHRGHPNVPGLSDLSAGRSATRALVTIGLEKGSHFPLGQVRKLEPGDLPKGTRLV